VEIHRQMTMIEKIRKNEKARDARNSSNTGAKVHGATLLCKEFNVLITEIQEMLNMSAGPYFFSYKQSRSSNKDKDY